MWQLLLLTFLATRAVADAPEEAEGVKYANKCEGEEKKTLSDRGNVLK